MASTTQDKLYETFVAISGQQDSSASGALDSGEEIAASLSDTVKQLGELQGSSEAQAATSGGSTAGSIVSTVLESGLGMVPLIVGLLGLFGGGGTPAGPEGTPALVKYAMPDPISFEGADTGSDVSGADFDQMGMPRTYSAAPQGTSAQASGLAAPNSSTSGAPSGPSGAGSPQITVNVQAMDSQSFLDHSSEIARAVRAAMLNSNAINDVVNDL